MTRTYLDATALGDFDGDGTVEVNADELAGLAGTEVTMVVKRRKHAASLVLTIGELDYLAAAPPAAD